MTEKPILNLSTWGYGLNELSTPDQLNRIERPLQSKIDNGWVFGEKPSHKSFNWNWKMVDEYIHHLNSNGIPKWDDQTSYDINSVVLYSPFIYQSLVDANQGTKPDPEGNSAEWKIVGQLLANFTDVELGTVDPAEEYLLQRKDDGAGGPVKWRPSTITSLLSAPIDLLDLSDVYLYTPVQDNMLAYDQGNRQWVAASADFIAKNDDTAQLMTLKDIEDKVSGADTRAILETDGSIWKTKYITLPSVKWGKILNKPDKFQPPASDDYQLGGVRVEVIGKTLSMMTVPSDIPSKPVDLTILDQSPQMVSIYWFDDDTGDMAYYYTVHRDDVKLPYNILDHDFEDYNVRENREYQYYVVAHNQQGSSLASNTVVANTYYTPYPPTNLTYELQGRTVTLYWEAPEGEFGDLSYYIYRNGVKHTTAHGVSYIDSDVPKGNYTYTVTAYNSFYESTESNPVSVSVAA
jgi:hypothetical protein